VLVNGRAVQGGGGRRPDDRGPGQGLHPLDAEDGSEDFADMMQPCRRLFLDRP